MQGLQPTTWLLLAVMLVQATVLVVTSPRPWRRPAPGAPEAERDTPAAVPAAAPPTRLAPAAWLRRHWQEVATGLLAAVAVAYLWRASPVTFSREFTQPGQVGHPFNGLAYVRSFQLAHTGWIAMGLSVGGALLSLALLALGRFGRALGVDGSRSAPAGLLVAGLALAGLGQLALLGYYPDPGPLLYGVAVLCFAGWAISYRPHLAGDLLTTRWRPWVEWALLAVAMLLTFYARFYKLSSVPYGIEGDESKWTIEIISAMVDGTYPHSTDYHLSSLPLSFYMQAPFHALFGPSILSGRIAVAAYSVLGSLAFYWLVRQLAGAPAAWLATMLLAISLLDISASRLGNVESHVKLWPLLALALLALAVRSGRLLHYALSGTAIAIGLLTYDTVAPIVGVAGLALLYETVSRRVAFADAVRRWCAFVAPVLIVAPVTAAYLLGRSQYYGVQEKGWESGPLAVAWDHFALIVQGLFVGAHGDFLFNRQGPLFSGPLLPWLALGLVLALLAWRRSVMLWALLFGLLFFVPVPILANAPFGRVFYPGLPAAYLLMALAMLAALRDIGRALGAPLRPALATLALCGLALLTGLNLFIAFNEVADPLDRQYRRALYDIALAEAGPATMVYFPYAPTANDPIEQEAEQLIWLGMRDPASATGERHPYSVLPLGSLLPALAAQEPAYTRAVVVADMASQALREQREPVMAALKRCYPNLQHTQGAFFDTFAIAGDDLHSPTCASGILTLAPEEASAGAGQSIELRWSYSGLVTPELSLECSAARPDTTQVEAEGFAGPGWEASAKFVSGFRGAGYLADNLGSQPATLAASVPTSGPFYVWVRALRRVADDYPAILSIDGQQGRPFAASDDLPLNTWAWQRVGPFTAASSPQTLSIARPYPESSAFMALFIDALIITPAPTLDPERDEIWGEPFVQELDHAAGGGAMLFRQEPGQYRCFLRASNSDRLVDATGQAGLRSNPALLTIRAP